MLQDQFAIYNASESCSYCVFVPDKIFHKANLDLKFLLRCKDSSFLPNFLNFCLGIQSLKAPLAYKQCQLMILQELIRQKKSNIIVLKKKLILVIPHCNRKLALLTLLM